MNNLALLYKTQGRYGEAEPLYSGARMIAERIYGSENPATLIFVNNLASLYVDLGRYREAEPLFPGYRGLARPATDRTSNHSPAYPSLPKGSCCMKGSQPAVIACPTQISARQ
jgi:hypothetical protein